MKERKSPHYIILHTHTALGQLTIIVDDVDSRHVLCYGEKSKCRTNICKGVTECLCSLKQVIISYCHSNECFIDAI